MSVKIIQGDLLNSKEDIILHQVNLQGYMAAGVAYQIAKKYPSVEKEYIDYLNKKLGEVVFAKTNTYVVGNCFSQNYDFTTNYKALEECLIKVKNYMNNNKLTSVAIPYKYGCGIASGDWEKVKQIFEEIFYDLELVIYKLV